MLSHSVALGSGGERRGGVWGVRSSDRAAIRSRDGLDLDEEVEVVEWLRVVVVGPGAKGEDDKRG